MKFKKLLLVLLSIDNGMIVMLFKKEIVGDNLVRNAY